MERKTKQAIINALSGISYKDWLEISWEITEYFDKKLKKSQDKLKLDPQELNN